MNRTFKVAWYIVVLGIVVMIVGEVWHLSANGDYGSAETRYIAASDDYDHESMVEAQWDMHSAETDMTLARTIFDFGFIGVALGIALIAYGLHERQYPQPMPMLVHYRPENSGQGPPPEYYYPQPPPGQRH